MQLTSGIIEFDLHGLRVEEAVQKAEDAVRKAPSSVYVIRLIHGYHRGTGIREAVEYEFSNGRNSKVKRVCPGSNPGITELILREF